MTIYDEGSWRMIRLTNNIVIAVPNGVELTPQQKIELMVAYKNSKQPHNESEYTKCLIKHGFLPLGQRLSQRLIAKPDNWLILEQTRIVSQGYYLEHHNTPAPLDAYLRGRGKELSEKELALAEDVYNHTMVNIRSKIAFILGEERGKYFAEKVEKTPVEEVLIN